VTRVVPSEVTNNDPPKDRTGPEALRGRRRFLAGCEEAANVKDDSPRR